MELNLQKMGSISAQGMQKLKVTYMYVSLGILLALIGASIATPMYQNIGTMIFIGLIVLEFGALFAFMYFKNVFTYSLFTFLTGVTLAPMLGSIIDAGNAGIIIQALVGTLCITSLLTIYAMTTKNNYLNIGTILFYILIGLLVMMILNIFIGSPILALGISMIAVALFSMFIIFDTQQVLYTDIEPLDAAMNLYLDILNLFVHLLSILNAFSKDD